MSDNLRTSHATAAAVTENAQQRTSHITAAAVTENAQQRTSHITAAAVTDPPGNPPQLRISHAAAAAVQLPPVVRMRTSFVLIMAIGQQEEAPAHHFLGVHGQGPGPFVY